MTSTVTNTETQTNTSWRKHIESFMAHTFVQNALVVLIVLNAAILGLETNHELMAEWGDVLHWLDHVILWIFIAEIIVLIAARGLGYFKDPWCVFDFIVVGIALIPASGSLSVLRALRVLRVLRLINKVESMRKVVGGLLSSLPGLGSVFGLILIIFYVAAVIATNLFREEFPEWFGHLGSSAYTLFQVMTLEGWSQDIARPVMEHYPHAWIFFVLFILIATFIIFNLFIAVIVDSITADKEKEQMNQNQFDKIEYEVLAVRAEIQQVIALRQEIKELRELLEKR
jgi:voltage-gated sodium channel